MLALLGTIVANLSTTLPQLAAISAQLGATSTHLDTILANPGSPLALSGIAFDIRLPEGASSSQAAATPNPIQAADDEATWQQLL